MKLLDRHVLRELIGPFLFGVAAFTSLMFAGKELFNITELLAASKISALTAVELVGLFLPSIIVMTLPMAMLLGALLGFGRLSGDSEVVALYASGVSLYRVAVPVVVMSVLVTAAGFVINEIVVPRTNILHEQIMKHANPEDMALSDKPFMFADVHDRTVNAIVFVQGGRDESTGALRNVSVVQYGKDGKPELFIYGKRAIWQGPTAQGGMNTWTFTDGYTRALTVGGGLILTARFAGAHTRPVHLERTPDAMAAAQKKPDEMSYAELKTFIKGLQAGGVETIQMGGRSVQELKVRLYQKISIPLAALVFALVGIPLGIRPQRTSSAMGLGLAIVIIFAYWVFTNYVTILGNNGTIAPFAAAFLPTAAGVAAGVALLVKAPK